MYPEPNKYTTMFLAFLTMLTALTISAVAIYYSVAGLVAIFAAAAIPIMIMGTTLEVAKLVTAVWLHRYWAQAAWWLKYYLALAVLVLMFITSMGIFGYLSKAHIEQTSAGEESIAQVVQIENEIIRQEAVITRAEEKIVTLENSGTTQDTNVQSQIDKEQDRIDKAFDRIKPAIEQQNKIITDARATDTSRTKPYEDQLTSIQAEVLRLESSASEYETKIAGLKSDSSGVEPLLAQIAGLESEIIRVTNQLQSKERDQIRAGQAIIGVTSDGAFGGNTRRALVAWVAAQRDRITQIQGEVASVRNEATKTVKMERFRLANVVKDIREVQIPALKTRELTMLGKIDEVRQTESPVIATARDEIQRLRESAEQQVAQSQGLINRLRSQLAQTDKADQADADIDEQMLRIKTAETALDILVEEKFTLEGEYRKLEAEVGPIKYIAEFVYGEQADKNMLEQAVTWVIIIIIFVFDPLAVLLLIASQYTFEFHRKRKADDDNGERLRLERQEFERARAQAIVDNPGFTLDDTVPPDVEDTFEPVLEVPKYEDIDQETIDNEFAKEEPQKKSIELPEESKKEIPDTANKMFYPEELVQKYTEEQLDELDQQPEWQDAKQRWKDENPNETLKEHKQKYTAGIIDKLPWEDYLNPDPASNEDEPGYIQNQEQNERSIWKTIGDK